jgi:hypothetical protein
MKQARAAVAKVGDEAIGLIKSAVAGIINNSPLTRVVRRTAARVRRRRGDIDRRCSGRGRPAILELIMDGYYRMGRSAMR